MRAFGYEGIRGQDIRGMRFEGMMAFMPAPSYKRAKGMAA